MKSATARGLPQPFELLVEFLVPRGVCTQTPRGLSEGWLAVPKEAADTVLEEQHVKMGIHGWVFSAHLREHSSRYVSHALWPRLSSTLSRSSRVLVYSAKGYYECEAA